jgi:hypothetical protein
MARRSQQRCDYLTETDDEADDLPEIETTIETSFMNLLASPPFVQPTPEPEPEPEGCTVFDTDGPVGENSRVCVSIIQLSIILSTTVVATVYILMGAYTYPVWP